MRIGIIGAGQLGQMLGAAARELGFDCRFLDPAEAPPAASVGTVVRAAFDDVAALKSFAARCDVITYEFENVPVAALAVAAGSVPVYPPLAALENAQDRLIEKQLFSSLDIPLPGYRAIDKRKDLVAAAEQLGFPIVVKTRRFGYDGKGQFIVASAGETDDVWRQIAGRAAIAEAWVPFDAEVSIIGVRGRGGETAFWPLTQNEHAGGILRTSTAPAPQSALLAAAEDYIGRLLEHLNYVGVLALELFVVGDGLLANEYAPRVHNSGHWTIEGAKTSQFENHLRAIAGLPLGDTSARGHAGMLNLLGRVPAAVHDLAAADCHVHDYGKAPRPGRKLGHITVVAATAGGRDRALADICQTVTERTPV